MSEECGDNPESWSKLCRIRYLLDHWQDIWDAGVTSTWATFTGTSHQAPASKAPSPLPPMAGHESVRRIERALAALPARERHHLKAYRCNAEWRCTDQAYFRRLPSGTLDLDERRVRERIVPPWVSREIVDRAEEMLVRLLRGGIEIPPEFWHALMGA